MEREMVQDVVSQVVVAPFRFWWSVRWKRGDSHYELLFKKSFRAHQYAHLLENGHTEEQLHELEVNRLR